MIHLILLVALFTGTASADDWICKSQSSVQRGTTVLACGIGEAETEAEARKSADENAIDQFRRVCDASDTCRNRQVSSNPGRTECEAGKDTVRCYRALTFEIGEKPSDLNLEIEAQKRALAALEEKKSQQDGLDDVAAEIKFSAPDPSYWNLGAGVTVGDTRFKNVPSLQVGFGMNFRRCFSDVFCPGVAGQFGIIKTGDVQVANFASASVGGQLYVYRRLYVHGEWGLEGQWGVDSAVVGNVLKGGVGIDAIRVKNVSISIETGVKGGPGSQVNVNSGGFINFKF